MKKNNLMNILAIHCLLFFTANISFSQVVKDTTSIESQLDTKFNKEHPKKDEDDKPVLTIVEVMPEFPGGINGLIKFLSDNIKYPDLAREENIQGNVFATFVVNVDGKISNIKILRGIGGGCDEEVVRVLKKMPNWKPGTQNKKNVAVQFNLPVNFRLSDDDNGKKTKKKKRFFFF